jgi:hypothetical protein
LGHFGAFLVAEITSKARKASIVPLNAVNEKQRKAGIRYFTTGEVRQIALIEKLNGRTRLKLSTSNAKLSIIDIHFPDRPIEALRVITVKYG